MGSSAMLSMYHFIAIKGKLNMQPLAHALVCMVKTSIGAKKFLMRPFKNSL